MGQLITNRYPDRGRRTGPFGVQYLIVGEHMGWDYMDKLHGAEEAGPFVTTTGPPARVSNAICQRALESSRPSIPTSTTSPSAQSSKASRSSRSILAGRTPRRCSWSAPAIFKDRAASQCRQAPIFTWLSGQGSSRARNGTFSQPRADVPPPAGPGATFVLQHRQPLPGTGVGRKPP